MTHIHILIRAGQKPLRILTCAYFYTANITMIVASLFFEIVCIPIFWWVLNSGGMDSTSTIELDHLDSNRFHRSDLLPSSYIDGRSLHMCAASGSWHQTLSLLRSVKNIMEEFHAGFSGQVLGYFRMIWDAHPPRGSKKGAVSPVFLEFFGDDLFERFYRKKSPMNPYTKKYSWLVIRTLLTSVN